MTDANEVLRAIETYLASQPEPKARDVRELHQSILSVSPGCRLWFLDGRDAQGRIVSNPNIGYGTLMMRYADGSQREFYRVGLSATKSGISVYIMGVRDKTFLARTYGKELGKASVTGYCIRFRALRDIRRDILEAALRVGFEEEES